MEQITKKIKSREQKRIELNKELKRLHIKQVGLDLNIYMLRKDPDARTAIVQEAELYASAIKKKIVDVINKIEKCNASIDKLEYMFANDGKAPVKIDLRKQAKMLDNLLNTREGLLSAREKFKMKHTTALGILYRLRGSVEVAITLAQVQDEISVHEHRIKLIGLSNEIKVTESEVEDLEDRLSIYDDKIKELERRIINRERRIINRESQLNPKQ